ncbi:outer membrane protein [Parablastomonas sp. CN1-191]|uniref:outer membrane protein n=1 Tax=Parablastomonas sp. CN1-191 TaxID=3400908 RepID=UPI003BF854F4
MKTMLTLAALAVGMAATPALAAPGGFHVGALAGYEGIKVKSADNTVEAKADSAVYGIDAGYDIPLGGAFVGVEGELSTSGGSTKFPSSFTGAREGLKANGQYYVGARAGFNLTPGIAAYGKVGYTSLDTKAFTSSGSLGELKERAGGVRYGAGLQMDLPGPLTAKLEYRHSRYKDLQSGTYGDANTNQVVAGVGVRF